MMNQSLATRIEFADVHYFKARLKALQRADPKNPYQIEIREFGAAVAFKAQVHSHLFHRVMGVHEDTIHYLDDILAWYGEAVRLCRFEIIPSNFVRPLAKALSARGFAQTGFYGAMYGSPTHQGFRYDQNIQVAKILSGDRELAADIYVTGFEISKRSYAIMRDSYKALFGNKDAHFYGASIGDRLVAVGSLVISDNMGYFASDTTLGDYRGLGCQMMLLRYRMLHAASAQCDLMVGHARFASASQRNMQRLGMQLAYTKAIWTQV
ncbi:MAG: hypothetical protein MUF87_01905 [Anaerolineae bacterium]|nr:hypothetical protein [Anaerolineae bacterium]